MNTAAALLDELYDLGFVVTITAGDRLRICPKVTDQALIERVKAAKLELLKLLREGEEMDRIAEQDAGTRSIADPAKSLISTCLEYGVDLQLESDGTLVVRGRVWRGLVWAIEKNADDIAALLKARWRPYDA